MVDAGNFAWKDARIGEAQAPQRRRKGELQLEAYSLVGVDAVLAGEGDLSLGLDWLMGAAAKFEVPVVATNLLCEGKAPFPTSRLVEKGDVTIGIVGVLSPADTVPEGCTVSDPEPAVREAVDLLGSVDVLVVLSQLDTAGEESLAERVGAVDLVVSSGRKAVYDPPRTLPGDALVFSSGTRGKNVGVADITLVPGGHGFVAAGASDGLAKKLDSARRRLDAAKEKLPEAQDDKARARVQRRIDHAEGEVARLEKELADATSSTVGTTNTVANRMVALRPDVADQAATLALVDKVKGELGETVAPAHQGTLPYDGPYVGSARCKSCHPAEDAQWQTTKHAQAWEALVREKRHLDHECFKCHVTGAHDADGPQSPAVVGALTDVGCESCHGPGKAHVADPKAGSMVKDPPEATCQQCHDGERDGGRFDRSTYRPRIVHGQ